MMPDPDYLALRAEVFSVVRALVAGREVDDLVQEVLLILTAKDRRAAERASLTPFL